MTSDGGIALSAMSAAAVTSLNVDPGGISASTALAAPSRPWPAMARMAPVWASMTIIDPQSPDRLCG